METYNVLEVFMNYQERYDFWLKNVKDEKRCFNKLFG